MINLQMNNQTKNQQLSSDQLKMREVAELYLKLQQNTQYLTHVVRYDNRTSKNPLWLNKPVDLRSIVNIIVQQSYLLYSCFLKKLNVFFSVELYTRPIKLYQSNPLQQAFSQYMLEIDFNRHSQLEQKNYLFRFRKVNLNNSPQKYGEYLCSIIRQFKTILKSQLQKAMKGGQNISAKQIFSLSHVVENIIVPQIKNLSPQAIILVLEETQAFREESLLVKCLNSSIFAAIRHHPRNREIYQQLIEIEANIILKYYKKVSELFKMIEQLIQKSFKKLMLQFNIVFSQVSLKGSKNQKTQDLTVKPYQLGQIEGNCPKTRKYILNIYLKEKPLQRITGNTIENIIAQIKKQPITKKAEENNSNSKQSLEGLSNPQKINKGEFSIQYFSSNNLLWLRYITNFELNIENSDILMFYCNYFTTSWSGISMQFVEKTSNKTKKEERFLCFKMSSYVNIKEKVIFNIFIMIDMLMVHYKIFEPQIRKDILNFDRNTNSIEELASKCEHMKHIFIKKIERYNQLIYQSLAGT